MDETIKILLNFTIPIATAFFAYYLGRKGSRKDYEKEIKRERYLNAYVPYINMLYKGFFFNNIDLSNKPIEIRTAFFEHLTQNIQYWDNSTLKIYPYFYRSYINLLGFEKDSTLYNKETPFNFYYQLNKITLSILEEAKILSTELSLPQLTEPFLNDYRQLVNVLNTSKRQKYNPLK